MFAAPPTSFGQPSAPYNPSHGTASSGNPSWSNPHYNPSQSYPPNPASGNIGFKDHLRPTSMPVPASASYPTSGFNPHSPPYPIHPVGHPANQPHSVYNPGYSHPIGHPSSYPSHIPPPVPGSFGNPYSTHPVGPGTYGPGAYGPGGGYGYQPQQHVLSQPAAQPYIPGQTVIMVPGQQDSGRGFGQMVKEALVFSTINAGVNRLINPHTHYVPDSRPAGSGTTSETHITYNNHYFNTPPSGTPVVPASPNAPQQNTQSTPNIPPTYPASYPGSVNNPAITPGVSIPTIAGNNVTYPAGSPATTNNTGSVLPVVPPGPPAGSDQVTPSQGTPVYSPQYRISDNELWTLTEELFAKQEINVSRYVTAQLQNKSENLTDAAKTR